MGAWTVVVKKDIRTHKIAVSQSENSIALMSILPDQHDEQKQSISSSPKSNNETRPAQIPPTTDSPEGTSVYVLDSYPSDIRRAILNAFEGKTLLASKSPGSLRKDKKDSAQQTNDLFSLLQSASGTGDEKPEHKIPTKATPEMSREEKRAEIRRRFLEAIEQAREERAY